MDARHYARHIDQDQLVSSAQELLQQVTVSFEFHGLEDGSLRKLNASSEVTQLVCDKVRGGTHTFLCPYSEILSPCLCLSASETQQGLAAPHSTCRTRLRQKDPKQLPGRHIGELSGSGFQRAGAQLGARASLYRWGSFQAQHAFPPPYSVLWGLQQVLQPHCSGLRDLSGLLVTPLTVHMQKPRLRERK